MDKPLTEKSRAAVTEAQGQALDRNNVTLEPEHVLYALVSQPDGLVPSIIRQLGREPSALQAKAEAGIQAILLEGLEISFVASQATATLVAMTFNFALNNVLTYRDMRLRGWKWFKGWLSFSLACSVGAFANVGIAAYIFTLDAQWVLAAISGIVVGAVWNYAVTMVYTWKKPRNTK